MLLTLREVVQLSPYPKGPEPLVKLFDLMPHFHFFAVMPLWRLNEAQALTMAVSSAC